MKKTKILIRSRWPSIPGHGGGTELVSGYCKAVSEDNTYWLVREKGLFRRWEWLPVNGQFVTLFKVTE